MKILSLTYEYPPIGGGGGAVAAALNEALVAAGDEVRVVTSGMPGLPRQEEIGGVQVHRTACWRRHSHYTTALEMLTMLWPAYGTAARLIEADLPDVIHTHFVLPSGLLAWLLSRRYGVPFVLTAHGSDIPGYNPDRFNALHFLLKPLWRRIVTGAAAVTSPSRFLTGLIRRQLDLPVEIIPNGYTPAERRSLPKRNVVLVVARLFPRKGVQYFIESLRGMQSDWEFVVAGDGPYIAALREQARELGCPVRFIGFVDKPALHDLYQETRIFVFPSLRENFPMVLLEAMDAGCAVITTDAEGCAEVVGNAGVVVEAGSPRHIRAALERLMSDEEQRNELSRLARRRARKFRWYRISRLYRRLFASVAGLPAPAPPLPKPRRPNAPVPPAAGVDLMSTGTFNARALVDDSAGPRREGN